MCAVLVRLGLNRLRRLEPPEPANRYCRRHPGELVHVDVKKLGRIGRPGHRCMVIAAPGSVASAGSTCTSVSTTPAAMFKVYARMGIGGVATAPDSGGAKRRGLDVVEATSRPDGEPGVAC